MAKSRSPVALETASAADLRALVPQARESELGGIDPDSLAIMKADEIEVYVAEMVAKAPPLSADLRARLAGLLDT